MSRMGIRVSRKHGVNPTLGVCRWCGEEDGTVMLLGRLPGDAAARRKSVVTREPCPKCREMQSRGITLFSEHPNGAVAAWIVLREEVLDRLVSDEKIREELRARRYGQVDAAVMVALRGEGAEEKKP